MEKKENKASAILMNIDIVVASIILAILIVLTFLGVVWRYIFNAPFTWLEEVQTSCMVWIVFAGAGAAFRSGNHVAIEMIVDLMPKSMQKIMEILISIETGVTVLTAVDTARALVTSMENRAKELTLIDIAEI